MFGFGKRQSNQDHQALDTASNVYRAAVKSGDREAIDKASKLLKEATEGYDKNGKKRSSQGGGNFIDEFMVYDEKTGEWY